MYSPWTFETPYASGGSGWLLSSTEILTTAHIVADAEAILVCIDGQETPVPARVIHLDHDRDLAMLKMDAAESRALADQTEFITTPIGRDDLHAVWFDHAKGTISKTHQTVEKVGVRSYSHSRRLLLALVTQPELPEGASGSVILDSRGHLAGIVFQGDESTNDVVHALVVSDFLRDVRSGLRGPPDLGVHWQKLEHPALRKYCRTEGETGILITDTVPDSSADGIIQRYDVLTAVGESPIDSDGTVTIPKIGMVDFSYIVSRRPIGDRLALEVIREGRPLSLFVDLKGYVSLIPLPRSSRASSYFILAGLVFRVLTFDYLSQWNWQGVAFRYKHFVYDADSSDTASEIVIMSRVLADEVNIPYQQMSGMRVLKVNGVRITQLGDVARATEMPVNGFHVIEVENRRPRIDDTQASDFGSLIVLSADDIRSANQRVLQKHSIESDRSIDLAEPEEPGGP